jgi:pyridoxal phosphate enzyme (YggS family)
VAELTYAVDVERVRRNVAEVREEVAAAATRAGRAPALVQVLAATKYVPAAELPKLAEAGIELVGENRAQELEAKVGEYGELFTWDFIGALQSRRVPLIVPHVRLIHSVASESALRMLERHIESARPGLSILIEVNVAGEEGKAGVLPAHLDELIELSPVPVEGLMTMPPMTDTAEESRRWFAALRELARERDLHTLSMGSTQDYGVAVEEGATIVRLGGRLYR